MFFGSFYPVAGRFYWGQIKEKYSNFSDYVCIESATCSNYATYYLNHRFLTCAKRPLLNKAQKSHIRE